MNKDDLIRLLGVKDIKGSIKLVIENWIEEYNEDYVVSFDCGGNVSVKLLDEVIEQIADRR